MDFTAQTSANRDSFSNNKKIVVCCDGVWFKSDKNPTNAEKFISALRSQSKSQVPQIAYYGPASAEGSFLNKLLYRVLGHGFEKSVVNAYRFIAENYAKSDQIYLLGVSRGAIICREVAGLIDAIGLLPSNQMDQLVNVYRSYRNHKSERLDDQYQYNKRPEIRMLGVWDSVGGFGAPIPVIQKLTHSWLSTSQTHLPKIVNHAFHAIAIDETRTHFTPNLWQSTACKSQKIEQVWFAGTHIDVTGGSPESGLSDISLLWMIEKAQTLGLEFEHKFLSHKQKLNPTIAGMVHQGAKIGFPFSKILKCYSARKLSGDPFNPPVNISIHESVREKIRSDLFYRPQNIDHNLPINKSDERRHQARYNTMEMPGTLELSDQITTCKIIDFNPSGGVRVQSDLTISEQDEVFISSSQFDQSRAMCVWKKGNLYGLKFVA